MIAFSGEAHPVRQNCFLALKNSEKKGIVPRIEHNQVDGAFGFVSVVPVVSIFPRICSLLLIYVPRQARL